MGRPLARSVLCWRIYNTLHHLCTRHRVHAKHVFVYQLVCVCVRLVACARRMLRARTRTAKHKRNIKCILMDRAIRTCSGEAPTHTHTRTSSRNHRVWENATQNLAHIKTNLNHTISILFVLAQQTNAQDLCAQNKHTHTNTQKNSRPCLYAGIHRIYALTCVFIFAHVWIFIQCLFLGTDAKICAYIH